MDTPEKIAGEMREFLDSDSSLDGVTYRNLFAFADRLLALRGEAVAWEYQHGETGSIAFCPNDGINNPENWGPNNPRYQYIGPVYRNPAPPISDAVREAVANGDRYLAEQADCFNTFNLSKFDWQTIRAFMREQGVE